MKSNINLKDLGERTIINIIEELIFKKTNQRLIRDDSFFYSLLKDSDVREKKKLSLIFNSDMLVSTTDIPNQMNFYQIGRKSMLMNVSDLIVKGANPLGVFVSLGLPSSMKQIELEDLIKGIIDYCTKLEINYIGGDLNETKEIIINPSVFGKIENDKIIKREGMNIDDFLVINRKFGLTGVGFDILLNDKNAVEINEKYNRAIKSVLEPSDLGLEGIILSENKLATASIDSSDGLARSLKELIVSNPNLGMEIEFDNNLIDNEAIQYSKEFDIPLDNLVLNAGEEFIHIFSIKPEKFDLAQKMVQAKGGNLLKIGKVISDQNIYILKNNQKYILNKDGYEHFLNSS
ncbi:MAG: hypothetical protein KGD57_04950 [Candidatus Lokiarchaeota archaeon]|nr:hypothetical protein [Candidatus Lokiarchaeota archaeon]